MRKQRILRAIAFSSVLALAVSATGLLSQQSAGELFEKALYTEEAQGDLRTAIGMYEDILKRFPNDREVAAKAQLHIGLCYEKLGLQEAPKAYQKVVDQYPEQKAMVELAKEKLSGLMRARSAAESGGIDLGMRKIGDLECLGAPSPDGRLISTVDWDSGDLALYDVASGKTRRLTNKGSWAASSDFAEMSIFSPDGKSIAYNWFSYENVRYDLRRINTDGTGQKILCSNKDFYYIWPCGWTRDGQDILAILASDGGSPSQIALISVADGSARTVKEFNAEGPGKLCLSPDGQWIAYGFPYQTPWNEGPEKRDLFLLSIDGRREVPLVTHPADDRLLGWSPDGRWILFSSNRSGTYDIWIQAVENGAAKGNPQLVKRDFGDLKTWQMGLTRDGSFYYGLRFRQMDIYVVPLDPETGAPAGQPEKAALGFEGSNTSPCWSPSGDRLAYTSYRDQDVLKPCALCVKSMISGEEREFYPDIDFVTVGWFPDGHSVLCCGKIEENTPGFGFFRIDLAGAEPEPQTQLILDDLDPESSSSGGLHGLALSRDGKRIFYDLDNHSGPTFRIMSYNIETRQKKELIRGPNQIVAYDISPDGKWLAFREPENGRACLKLIPSEGGEKRILLKLGQDEGIGAIAWSPDSRFIYFSKREKGSSKNLWRIPAEGGTPEEFDVTVDVDEFSVSPDGKKMVLDTWLVVTEIWVMENFLPGKEEK